MSTGVGKGSERATGAGGARSITEFLTDGSLAALCAELASLTGLEVELHDHRGQAIRRTGEASWSIGEARLAESAARTRFPLVLGAQEIGSVVVGPGEPRLGTDARQRMEGALRLLVQAAGELIQHEEELRHRIREIGALAHMSQMLGRADGPEKVLQVALDSALEVLELDAGSVVLFREDAAGGLAELEEDVQLKASRNLSRDWLERTTPLSKDRLFDRLASRGEVVVSEDLAGDPRILIAEQAAKEGLRAAVHAGLIFKGRALGVMRLYARRVRSFDAWEQRMLQSLAMQAAAAVEQARLLRFEQEEQRVQRQLQLAANVQKRMLPRGVPSIPQLDVAAKYVPSFELGGDFYDFIDLGGHLGVVIGDVVGKGIAAALLMSSVRASLRAHTQKIYDMDEVVARVNQALCMDTKENEFASLWFGVIDPQRLRLTYCSAGHEPPLVVRMPPDRAPQASDVDELSVGGMVVGIDPRQRYQRALFDLRPGDVIVAYTDGVPDAMNFGGERFGKKRVLSGVLAALGENWHATAAQVVERILWEVRQFSGLSTRNDDQTIVVVRVPEKR